MYILNVFIEGEKVELFSDENVTLNSSVQNINDLSKVFTDYTQSFTIPASVVNSKLLGHWYNADIVGGFDASVRANARLELNFMPFKVGLIQLDSATLKNGKVFSYKITFYSNVVKLSDLFGDDLLNDLDLSAYNHDYSSANIKLGIEGAGLSSGSIIYPLISPVRNWLWDSNTVDDIFYKSATLPSTTNGIDYSELKPAIKLTHIVDAIEAKYGITFSTEFFGTTDFAKLFMWMARDKGYIAASGEPSLLTFSAGGGVSSFNVDVDAVNLFDQYIMIVTPTAGFETVEYNIIIDDGTTALTYPKVGTGIGYYSLEYDGVDLSEVIEFKIQSNTPFSFDASLVENETLTPLTNHGTTGTTTTTGKIYCTDLIVDGVLQKGQMPKMKIGEFLSSLFKMFNLVILPTSAITFDVMTLDVWYSNGTDKDITKYIDLDKIAVKRPNLNKRISFEYADGDTILNQVYQDTNAINYGDLDADFVYDGGELSITSGFENILMERLSGQVDGVLSDTHVGKIIDDKLEDIEIEPFVFYNKGVTTLTTLTNALAFISDTSVRSEVLTYNNVGQENFLTNGAITNSLNFGNEISSWTLAAQTESLYSNYWETYITDLYNPKRRLYNYDAVIPHHIFSSLLLNDKLIIRDRKYIINRMKANLTNGKVQLELLNDV